MTNSGSRAVVQLTVVTPDRKCTVSLNALAPAVNEYRQLQPCVRQNPALCTSTHGAPKEILTFDITASTSVFFSVLLASGEFRQKRVGSNQETGHPAH